MDYTTDEYSKAQDTVDLYNHRAITVMRNCGIKDVLKWFSDCEDTFVSTYANGETGEVKVVVTLWMGYEYSPMHHTFEFPWELMNLPNDKIPDAYAKWKKEEDERLAARKAAKDKYWEEVRRKWKEAHPDGDSKVSEETKEATSAGKKHTYCAYFDTSVPADAPADGIMLDTDEGDEYAVGQLAQILEFKADGFPIENVARDGEDWYEEFNEILGKLTAENRVYENGIDEDSWEWIEDEEDADES